MINKELKQYVETYILPKYEKNESGHGVQHIREVVKRSFMFAEQVEKVNLNIVYTVACYHDIGHNIDAKHHEQVSAEIFIQDEYIKTFFTEDEVQIIFEAIQDHRASGKIEPRSVYGRIVSSADRRTNIDDIVRTMCSYNLRHHAEFTLEEHLEEAYSHICRKFADGGYATNKMYFVDEEYDELLRLCEWFKNNKAEFIKFYCKVNGIDFNILSNIS